MLYNLVNTDRQYVEAMALFVEINRITNVTSLSQKAGACLVMSV